MDVMQEMADGSVDAVITDPPYGIDWNCDYRSWTKPSAKAQGGKSNRTYPQIYGDKEPFDPSFLMGYKAGLYRRIITGGIMGKIQRGQAGEMAAEYWFRRNGWHMIRTQPAIQIVRVKPGKHYGMFVEAKLVGKGGIPDFTGYMFSPQSDKPTPLFCACEVKEAIGPSMPCSRLDIAQREFMTSLPAGCGYVGILWDNGKFELFAYKPAGTYKKGEGTA